MLNFIILKLRDDEPLSFPTDSSYDFGRLLRRSIAMLRSFGVLVLLAALAPAQAAAGKPKPCVTADEATRLIDKDVCVSAHVYDVVELPDGTRFLDVCAPQTPDEQCRFTLVSLWEDRDDVGELRKYRDMDVQVRGIVRSMHGRAGMVVSHARQFYGGPPKFKPNPKLARGFTAEESRPPIRDPNLRTQGLGRSFMNSREREALPGK
ncbi:MAG TPA: hypothetical protein VGF01_00235 [Terracidiphilus sp.]